MELDNERCRKCRWADYAGNIVICGYFIITGKLRGCPGGDKCTKFEPGKERDHDEL